MAVLDNINVIDIAVYSVLEGFVGTLLGTKGEESLALYLAVERQVLERDVKLGGGLAGSLGRMCYVRYGENLNLYDESLVGYLLLADLSA